MQFWIYTKHQNIIPKATFYSYFSLKSTDATQPRRADLSIEQIAEWFNPILRGWINYYGRYHSSALRPVLGHFNKTLIRWAMQKHRKLKGKARAVLFIQRIYENNPELFEHWKKGIMKDASTT